MMLKNPHKNALLAALYIVILVSMIFVLLPGPDPENSVLMPILMLSLLTLSVAVMSVLFFYTPVRMFMEGDKDNALKFFGKTILTFAGFVVIVLLVIIFFIK